MSSCCDMRRCLKPAQFGGDAFCRPNYLHARANYKICAYSSKLFWRNRSRSPWLLRVHPGSNAGSQHTQPPVVVIFLYRQRLRRRGVWSGPFSFYDHETSGSDSDCWGLAVVQTALVGIKYIKRTILCQTRTKRRELGCDGCGVGITRLAVTSETFKLVPLLEGFKPPITKH